MATKRASLILSVDGGAQFKQALNNATKETRLYKTELSSVQETYKENANGIEALTEKQEALLKIQKSYQKQLEAAKAGHQNAVKEYEKQSEAVDKLSEQLEEAKKALDDYQKSGGSDSGMTKSLQQNVEDVAAALEKQKQNLGKAEGKVTDWQKAQVKAAKDLQSVDRELDKNEKYLDEAAKSADGCAKSIDKFGKETKDAAGDVNELSGSSNTMMDTLKGMVGADFITTGVHALADAAKEAIEYVIGVGSEYEAAMSKVEALSGATGGELEKLDAKARELGASTQFSASEVAEAMSNMALAGWSTQEMLEGIDGVLYLAASGQMELASASDAVAGYLAAFNLEAKDAAHLSDVMATAQAKSKTTADQLAEAYSTSATNLTGYGQNLETTTALLEAMASVNDTGSAAGTKLNAVMAQIVQKMEDGSIAVGDTRVAVQDANGDFRSMIDIIGDIEKATDGMAEADRAAALQKTFNRTSLSGLNELLAVGSEQLRAYQTDLENCDGAAQGMATTMNDNLSGDLKELDSAVEGLGLKVYDHIKGPLRLGVDLITGAVNGLSNILDSPSDKFSTMVENVDEANKKITDVMKNVDSEYESAQQDATRVAMLVEQLKKLNEAQQAGEGTETDALARKMQMQAIIDELGGEIPEIAEAWNAETGELSLNNEELSKMVENYKNLAIQKAAMNAMQEVTNGLIEAQIALEEGQANATVLEKRRDGLEKLKEAWEQMNASYQNAMGGEGFFKEDAVVMQQKQIALLDEAYRNNIITLEEYNDLVKHSGDVGQLENSVQNLRNAWEEADGELDSQNKGLEKLQENVDEAQGKYDSYGEIVTNATEKINKSAEDTSESVGEATDSVITFSLKSKEATEGASQGYEDLGEAAEGAAEDVDASAEAMKKALEDQRKAAEEAAKEAEEAAKATAKAQSELAETSREESDKVIKALSDIRDEAQKTVEFDFFGEFDGGVDESVDAMLSRAQDNIEALQQYQTNLKLVSDHVGKEIAPEFLAYLESLGVNGANMLQQISDAFERDGGAETVKQWSDAYVETLNIQDETAQIIAGDKIALQGGLKDLGSTPVEFEELRTNIEIAVANGLKGWERLPEGTREKLEETVRVCEQIGVKIPDGISEGIISGQTSPEEAIDKMNAAISGRFDGLLTEAESQGLEITEGISTGMDQGGDALVTAYEELIALITQTKTDAETEMNSKGADVGAEFGSGVGSATADAETGAQSLTDAATGKLDENQSSFSTSGENAGKEYGSGLSKGETAAKASALGLARAAETALRSYNPQFRSVGENISAGVAMGIYAGSSWVTTAANAVANAAVNAAKNALGIQSPSSVFREEVGVWIPAGIAAGINQNKNVAAAAVKKLSKDITQEASSWVKDRKKQQDVAARDEANFWKGLAATVDEGTTAYQNAMRNYASAAARAENDKNSMRSAAIAQTARNFGVSRTKTEGSGDNQKTVLKEAEDYYGEIYSAASRYFSNIKSVSSVSAEQEYEYWSTVAKSLKVGTDAWYDAQSQMKSARQQMTKDEQTYADSAKRLAEQAAQAQNEARQKVVDDAEDYIRKKKILNNVDLQQELEYWTYILHQLDIYTDQWYDVYERTTQLRQDIIEEQQRSIEEARQAEAERLRNQQDNQSKLLSNWKTYYKVSAKAEMQYWDQARRQFKEGTDERIDADDKYFSAKEAYYDELKRLDEQYRSDYASIQSKMQGDIDSLTQAYKDAVKSREESILSSMNLFDAWDSEGVSGAELLRNLTTQVEGLERYTVVLDQLRNRKILDDEVIDDLTNMGPDAAANIAGLAALSDAELAKYNELYRQRQALAHQQALSDNRAFLAETVQGITDAQQEAAVALKELNGTYNEQLAELNGVIEPALQHWLTLIGAVGQNLFDGTNGILGGNGFNSVMRDALEVQVQGITETVETKLERLEEVIPNIGERALHGLMKSMSDKEKIISATDDMIATIKEELLNADFYGSFGAVPTVDFGGLNETVSVSEDRRVTVDNSDVVKALNKAVATIEAMTTALAGANVVLDTGETVGALQLAISQAQADDYLTYNRGRL